MPPQTLIFGDLSREDVEVLLHVMATKISPDRFPALLENQEARAEVMIEEYYERRNSSESKLKPFSLSTESFWEHK